MFTSNFHESEVVNSAGIWRATINLEVLHMTRMKILGMWSDCFFFHPSISNGLMYAVKAAALTCVPFSYVFVFLLKNCICDTWLLKSSALQADLSSWYLVNLIYCCSHIHCFFKLYFVSAADGKAETFLISVLKHSHLLMHFPKRFTRKST